MHMSVGWWLSVCVRVCVCVYCAVSVCACDVVEDHCCSTVEYETGQTEEHATKDFQIADRVERHLPSASVLGHDGGMFSLLTLCVLPLPLLLPPGEGQGRGSPHRHQ